MQVVYTIGIRPRRFGPWWFQKLLRMQVSLVEIQLSKRLDEFDYGEEVEVDGEIGASPLAPRIMETCKARVRGGGQFVEIVVDEFTLTYPRDRLRDELIIAAGVFQGTMRVMTKTFRSEENDDADEAER